MARAIREGDVVTVVLTNNSIHPLDNWIEHCKITHVPSDTGDSYHLETAGGVVFTINPNCSEFVGLVRGESSTPAKEVPF